MLATTWNEKRVELLKKLWADRRSARTIADALGGITRNAVIGKVHRLGLPGRAKSAGTSGQRPRKARALPCRTSGQSVRGETDAAPEAVEHEPAPIGHTIPIGQRCTILELTKRKCRWPIGVPGQPGFYFCGGQPVRGLPYCAYHAKIAYVPPKNPATRQSARRR